jgi:hypothetical protein
MGGIDLDGGEQRVDFPLETPAQIGDVGGAQVALAQHVQPLFAQLGDELIVPASVLLGHHGMHHPQKAHELLAAIQRSDAVHRDAGLHLLEQGRHADLEEFVQVVRHDGEELEPLQHGILRMARFGQNAPVEREPGEIAIDVAGIAGQSGVGGGIGHGEDSGSAGKDRRGMLQTGFKARADARPAGGPERLQGRAANRSAPQAAAPAVLRQSPDSAS